jgi:hypothetical protein
MLYREDEEEVKPAIGLLLISPYQHFITNHCHSSRLTNHHHLRAPHTLSHSHNALALVKVVVVVVVVVACCCVICCPASPPSSPPSPSSHLLALALVLLYYHLVVVVVVVVVGVALFRVYV